jgi:hypothetical protein
VFHAFAPGALNDFPTLSISAVVAIVNLDKLGTGGRYFVHESTEVAAVIAVEGLESPRLKQLGRKQNGVGHGDRTDGTPGAG